MKAIIKDLCRLKGLNHETVNYFTSFIEPESTFEDLMKKCLEVERLKKFIKDNTDIVNTVYLLFRQQKTSSIHAAGMVITPREKPIASLTPIKDINGIKVTEWEMEHIDKSGFLKQDILGIRQLDKFKAIINLIHQKTGKKITYDDIGLHEPDVYWLFQEGYNEDVFQFGATGLRAYCQDLKPESLEDLIATVALYRPGAMEINAHTDYIAIKNGKKSIKYDWGTEEVTKKTFSLLIYQEQIMQICQKLGGFSLEEADDIRSAMGKKKMDKMMFYKDIFIERAIKNRCPEIEAITIWNKMEGFAGYAFNRSHAVAYAITGYISQWFKSKYPLEFWTVSLQYSDDDTISNKISEINKISDIKVSPVDINNSQVGFVCKNNTIYWSLNSISYLGDVATQEIINQRQLGGAYFSLEEFIERVDKSKVNKRIIVNLILSGAFDEASNIKYPRERFSLIEKYFSSIKQDLPEMYSGKDIWNDVFWVKIQKQLSGIGYLNLQKLFENSTMFSDKLSFVPSNKFWSEGATGRNKVVAGFVKKATKRNSTRGSFLVLSLDFDSEIIPITIWGDYYEGKEDEFKGIEEKLLIISGELKFDKFNGKNCLFVNSKDKHIIL